MTMKVRSAACAIAFALIQAASGWAQADVNESLETVQLYVNTQTGSDSNPGTSAKPLKTIGAAAGLAETNNQKNVGTRVIILPGTYREAISLQATSKDTTAPETFEAQTDGTVIVSGADVWTGWQASSGNSKIFVHSWPYQWGLCPAAPSGPTEQDIVRRREMIFINGQPLTQVLASSELQAGTFYVNETGGQVSIDPPAGINPNSATVEVATRQNLLTVQDKSDVVLRGLTFEDSDSCRWHTAAVSIAADQQNGSNILVDTDNFLWNNGQGLNISGVEDVTVTNSVARHNGESGFAGYKVKYSLWQSDDTSYNNWRGAQGAYYNWNSSGAHFMLMRNQTVSGLTVAYNTTHGIHWDTDNADISASGVVASQNMLMGTFVEADEGPVLISNSDVCGGLNSSSNIGIGVKDSTSLTLSGDTLTNSGAGQIVITGPDAGEPVTNWVTGVTTQMHTEDLTITNSVIEGGSSSAFDDGSLSGTPWTDLVSTLVSDYNTWNPGSAAFIVPTPQNGTKLNLSGWQSLTGQDKHSVAPATVPSAPSACQITPDSADFWLLLNEASNTVSPGQQTSFGASVVAAGFNGTVSLGSAGVSSIPGATGKWSANSSATGHGTSFNVQTSASTPAGTYPITLIASEGAVTHTVTVSLVVQP
jgi:hypothetical protein